MSWVGLDRRLMLIDIAALPESFEVMPTVCLFVMSRLVSKAELTSLVETLVLAGCRYFMTWGGEVDLHDSLDEVLEDHGEDWLNVVTTSHKNESVQDVAWYMLNAAMPREKKLRVCICVDESFVQEEALLCAVGANLLGLR